MQKDLKLNVVTGFACSNGGYIIIRQYVRVLSGFNLNVKLFLLNTFIVGLYAGIYSVIFNVYLSDLGFREDFLGLLLSISLITTAAMSLPGGILCDRFGRRKVMVISGLLSIFATVPQFIFTSPAILLAFSALGGISGALSTICVAPFLIENSKDDGSIHIFSANSALGWLATVIGCALGGIMPALWSHIPGLGGMSNYRLTLLASAVLLVIGWTLLLPIREDRAAACPTRKFLLKGIRISSNLARFTVISIIMGIGSGMVVPYFNIYFTKIIRVGVLETGMVFAIADIFMVLGFMFIPYLSTKLGKVRAAAITQAASVPFLILMAFTTNFMIASTAYIARMLLMNMAGPATSSFQMEQINAEERGFATGFISMGNSLAIAASTYISGILMSGGSYVLPYAVTCVAYMLAAWLLYYYFRDAERTGPVMTEVADAGTKVPQASS